MSETSTRTDDNPVLAPPFALECAAACHESWGASFEHPFVLALANGSLEPQKFRFYQMQDARYLEAFADACSIISTKYKEPDGKLWFIDAARLAIIVEQQLHVGYGKRLGYSAEDIRRLEPTPNNKAYQDHMIACTTRGSLVEAIAAVAPCPWLYTDLGRHLLKTLGDIDDTHPYADWLRTYADPAFVTYTNDLLRLLQLAADESGDAHRERARDAFACSVRYEWMFWEQAWQQQRWPV